MARRAATAEAPPQTPENAAPDADVPSVGEQSETAGGAEPAAAAEAPPRRRGRPPGRRAAPDQTGEGRGQASPAPAPKGRHSGAETHAAVKRLLRSGSLSHKQAFERLAANSGRRPSAISAAYYRIERAAEPVRRHERRRPAASVPAPEHPEPNGTAAALAAVRAAIDQLAAAVERQERELARAESERDRYAKIRDIVGAELSPAPAGRRGRR